MLDETPAQFSIIQIKASNTPPPLSPLFFSPHSTFVFIALIGKVTHAYAFSREQIIMYLQNNSGASKQTGLQELHGFTFCEGYHERKKKSILHLYIVLKDMLVTLSM